MEHRMMRSRLKKELSIYIKTKYSRIECQKDRYPADEDNRKKDKEMLD